MCSVPAAGGGPFDSAASDGAGEPEVDGGPAAAGPGAESEPGTPAGRYAAFRRRQAEPELVDFRSGYGFEFDPFQLDACRALGAGSGVLVAAPTGSGKTVVGEFAVHLALARGGKCFYTTPLKALSNQKYGDLVRRYGGDKVGLLTGDNSVNGDAPVVVMTTEVLRNMLYARSATLDGLGYVVLDEVHYLADRSRGAVWEEVIIHLPARVLVVALSATVSNAEEFGDWLDQVRGGVTVIVDEHRPVPLWQHMMVGRRLYDLYTDPVAGTVNPELARLAQRDRWAAQRGPGGARSAGHGGRGGSGGQRYGAQRHARQRYGRRWQGAQRHEAQRYGAPQRHGSGYRPPDRPEVVAGLDTAGLLPAIVFIFSRAGCDAAVTQCLRAGLWLTDPDEADEIAEFAQRRTADLPDEDLAVLGYGEWLTALRCGIAAHHAGMLPAFKEVVEELFAAGLVRVVFATETLSLGINMPARTVVIERLDKWNGETHVELTPGEYTQLTGRAGRRGIDVEGHAVVLGRPGVDPHAVAGLAGTRTYQLNSSFRPSYNMAVNLTGRVGRAAAASLLESSFAQFQDDRGVLGLTRQLRTNERELAALAERMHCDRGDLAAYTALSTELAELTGDLARRRATARRAAAAESIASLRRGDIIRVPGGRRAGFAVVLESGSAAPGRGGTRSGDGSGPDLGTWHGYAQAGSGPVVLTANRQVRRLTLADFPVPVAPIDRVRVPGTFNPRSPQARRDLAASLRTKLAGLPPGGDRGRAPEVAGDERSIAELRRRVREHPCHACPDLARHAKYAERHRRLQLATEKLERRVAARSHVIARTFDRVCAVLDHLGYLRGDTVTDDGRRLAGIYSEFDLLAAECLRRHYWDGLQPRELAGCVSALTYESRKTSDGGPPRLPPGAVREVLPRMLRTWGELDAIEKNHHVSFQRDVDLGFVRAAYEWAGGARLDDVLDGLPNVTPGDFVRAVKQLVDLLDQIAGAAGDAALAAAARAAVDGLRRGIVSYSPATESGADVADDALGVVGDDATGAAADGSDAAP